MSEAQAEGTIGQHAAAKRVQINSDGTASVKSRFRGAVTLRQVAGEWLTSALFTHGSSSSVRQVTRGRAFLAGGALAAGALVIYLVLRGPGDAPDRIADGVGSDCSADNGHLAVNDPYENPGYFKRYYGSRFDSLVNAHAVHVMSATCEVAGGGAIYFKFDSHDALQKAIEAHPKYPPLCVLSATEMFDDDYVNSAAQQLADICDDLGGHRTRG